MSAVQDYNAAASAFDQAASICELAILNNGDIAATWTALEAAMGNLRRAAAALHAQTPNFDTARLGAAIERKKACAKMRLAGRANHAAEAASRRRQAAQAAERDAELRRRQDALRQQEEALRAAARAAVAREAALRRQEELREAAWLREQRTARVRRPTTDKPSTGRPKTWKEMLQEAQQAAPEQSRQPEQPAHRVETPATKDESENKKVFEFFNLVMMTPFVTFILFKAMNFGLAFMLLSAYCGFLVARKRGLSADLSTVCQEHPWLLWGSFFAQAICSSIGYLTF